MMSKELLEETIKLSQKLMTELTVELARMNGINEKQEDKVSQVPEGAGSESGSWAMEHPPRPKNWVEGGSVKKWAELKEKTKRMREEDREAYKASYQIGIDIAGIYNGMKANGLSTQEIKDAISAYYKGMYSAFKPQD